MKPDPQVMSMLKKFDEYPELISAKEREILRIKNDLDELSYFKTKREVFVKSAVSMATNEDSKKLYTNESMREKESYSRLKSDEEYTKCTKDIKLFETNKTLLEIELLNLKNRLSSLKYQVRIFEMINKE